MRGRKGSRLWRASGNSSAVERQPSKLGVAGSNPVSRSTRVSEIAHWTRLGIQAHVAQSAERVLGKDEVSGSSPDMGSIFHDIHWDSRERSCDGGPRDGQAEV